MVFQMLRNEIEHVSGNYGDIPDQHKANHNDLS